VQTNTPPPFPDFSGDTPSPAAPPAAAAPSPAAMRRRISPLKVILALILFASLVFCCLIALAGGVAILHEAAAPGGRGGVALNLALTGKAIIHYSRTIIHHFVHHRH